MKKAIANSLYMLMYLGKYCKTYIWVTILISCLSSVSVVLNVLLIRVALNVTSSAGGIKDLAAFVTGQALFTLAFIILNCVYQNRIMPRSLQRFQQKMQQELFVKATEVELEKYDDPEFYNSYILALDNSDIRAISLFSTYVTLLSSLLSIIGLTTIISSMNSFILVLALINVAGSLFLNLRASKTNYELSIEQVQPSRKNGYIRRVFYLKDYAKEMRLTDISKVLFAFHKEVTNDSVSVIKKYERSKSIIFILQSLWQTAQNITVIIYLAWLLIMKTIKVGDFAALLNGSNQLTANINSVIQIFPKVYEQSLYIDKFRSFMDYNVKNSRGTDELVNFHSLEYRNSNFSYPGNNSAVIHNINLTIREGDHIAIVGPNGAGKTTLAKLALGLYDDQEHIFVNQKPLNCYSKKSISNCMGAVFQDFQVYSVSIAENILMRPIKNEQMDSDVQVVKTSLQKVGLWNKVSTLENGIFTNITRELDDEGIVLSGGEMQRLAIARVFAHPYEVLVLDEPSSALDSLAEKEIFNIVLDEYKDRTVIIISHRLANLRSMDCIYYLENGSIMESGTHLNLISLRGKYFDLYDAKM